MRSEQLTHQYFPHHTACVEHELVFSGCKGSRCGRGRSLGDEWGFGSVQLDVRAAVGAVAGAATRHGTVGIPCGGSGSDSSTSTTCNRSTSCDTGTHLRFFS